VVGLARSGASAAGVRSLGERFSGGLTGGERAVSAAGVRGGSAGVAGVQAAAGSALIRASGRMKSCCQGQPAGRWSVHWRAVRVSRLGMVSSRRRRVRAARTEWPGRPITKAPVARAGARPPVSSVTRPAAGQADARARM
jgi:hypothetical protein